MCVTCSLSLSADEPLCVSKIMQKIKIEVNEHGTKAAAATGRFNKAKKIKIWVFFTF